MANKHNPLPTLAYCVLQIRDRIDGQIYFIDRELGSSGLLKAGRFCPHFVTADEYVEVMIWIHEKNYSLVKCVEYHTLTEGFANYKKDFYRS